MSNLLNKKSLYDLKSRNVEGNSFADRNELIHLHIIEDMTQDQLINLLLNIKEKKLTVVLLIPKLII